MARHEGQFEAAAEAELGDIDLALLAEDGAVDTREAALVRFLVGDTGPGEALEQLGGSFAPMALTPVKRG